MVTPLGTFFFSNKKTVSQCDEQIIGTITETLVINFDQEKFDQLLSEGNLSPVNVRKHQKISLAKTPMAKTWKPKSVSAVTNLAPCELILVSCETHLAAKLRFGEDKLKSPPVRLTYLCLSSLQPLVRLI